MKRSKYYFLLTVLCVLIIYSCDIIDNRDLIPSKFDMVSANPDQVTTMKNTPVKLDLLRNDSIGKKSTLRVGNGKHGTVRKDSSLNYIYYPDSGFVGTDSVIYSICKKEKCDSGIVVITVKDTLAPIDSAYVPDTTRCVPVAQNDSVVAAQGVAELINVLSNDSICDSLIFNFISTPAHGVAEINGNYIKYTSHSSFVGVDFIKYKICNTSGKCSEGLVKIFVTGLGTCNFQIVADTLSASLSDSLDYKAYVIDVLKNDQVCDSSRSLTISQASTKANLEIENNKIIYRLKNVRAVSDQFKYKVCASINGELQCKEAAVYVILKE